MLIRLAHVPDSAARTVRASLVLRRAALTGVTALMLAACAQPWEQFQAGQDQSAIIARMGPPREVYDLPGGGRRLMWPTQPMGSTTVAADVDASGKIVSVRQVLQLNEFNRAEIGKWTRDDVLTNFGRPVQTQFFRLSQREVWSYRYTENNINHMLFNFAFDTSGVLRETQRMPDPLFERNLRRF
ncbi:putative lipoprotein [Burkholderia sp. H160]|nr:putative lipoprotein [Burkholderia sp. H160]